MVSDASRASLAVLPAAGDTEPLQDGNTGGHEMMHVLKAGALYFPLVIGAGFVLGPIRILWVVPRFGTRLAELMEMPIMLVIVIVAARWVVRRFATQQFQDNETIRNSDTNG